MINNDIIQHVTNDIVQICSPEKIFLISNKISITGELTGFKLCVIVDDNVPSVSELECSIYMKIDSEVPYDLIFYKHTEWDKLKNDIGTFAWKINNTGTIIYE